MANLLYISSSELHLLTGSLYALIIFSYFPLPLIPGNYQSTLCFYEFEFYKWVREMKLYSSCLSLSGLFQLCIFLKFYPRSCKWQDFHLLYGWIIFHYRYLHVCVCAYFFIYPSINEHLHYFRILVKMARMDARRSIR